MIEAISIVGSLIFVGIAILIAQNEASAKGLPEDSFFRFWTLAVKWFLIMIALGIPFSVMVVWWSGNLVYN